jgi:hypothetical protein
MVDPLTLYRVGKPSIGEAWPARYSWSRSTGGIGTGVYMFRDKAAATGNIERVSPDKDLIVFDDALENPIQPRTQEATDALNRCGRVMALLASRAEIDEITFAEARDRGEMLRFSLGGFDGEGFGSGEALSKPFRTVLFDTPELRDAYGYDIEGFVMDGIDAAEAALRDSDGRMDRTSVQPMNKLLYPEHDGVAPVDGAGGNIGQYGCVIFKEVVDKAVGRETESFEEVEPSTLQSFFNSR